MANGLDVKASAFVRQTTATPAEVNKLDGAGAVVASGTPVAHIVDLANDANGTAIATAVNKIITALETFKIAASS